MSKRIAAMFAACLMLLTCANALAAAVRLHNKDTKAYKLYVKHDSSAVHTSINARAVTNICSSTCTIRLIDTGSELRAQPGDRLMIKDGKLVRRAK